MSRRGSRAFPSLVAVTGLTSLGCLGGGIVGYDAESGCCIYIAGNAAPEQLVSCPADTPIPEAKGTICTADGQLLQARPANPDADHDGHRRAEDCDDQDATVHPGAAEVAGDRIDQDCDGKSP